MNRTLALICCCLLCGLALADNIVWSDGTNLIVTTGGGTGTNVLGPVSGLVGGALFAGSGTTGTVTSAGGDAGKYLKADGTWDTPSGSGAETDPLSIHTSGTYTAWSTNGVSGSAEGQALITDLLTNGLFSFTYSSGGDMSLFGQWSPDGTNWSTYAGPTNRPGYMRVMASKVTGLGTGWWISNAVATSYTHTNLWGVESDTAGQILLVDTPATGADSRQAANVAHVAAKVAAITPAQWAAYEASEDVRLGGNKLHLGNGWTLTDEGGYGWISFDATSSTQAMVLAANGFPSISATSGWKGLHIDTFEGNSLTNAVLWVSTNGCTDRPVILYTSNLLLPDWSVLTPLSSTYPTVTNSAYRIEFAFPDGPVGYAMAAQTNGAALLTLHHDTAVSGDLTVSGSINGTVTNALELTGYAGALFSRLAADETHTGAKTFSGPLTATAAGSVSNSLNWNGVAGTEWTKAIDIVTPMLFGGGNGAAQTVEATELYWAVAYSDTDAFFTALFYVPYGGSFKPKMRWQTTAANTSKTMSGKLYADTTTDAGTYSLQLNYVNWDLAIPNTIWTPTMSIYGSAITVPDNALVKVSYSKDDNAGGASGNVRVTAILLDRQ